MPLKKYIILYILVVWASFSPLKALSYSLYTPQVPTKITYCGIEVELTPELQAQIQKLVNQILSNQEAFRKMNERADLYMPFVEYAFHLIDVPDDLKYIVIQESSLIADAVSSSNAVGFWQFKEMTATEIGLYVNEFVDERKHIFRSSVGAARYLKKKNNKYNNWVYAVIAYYAGANGAIPFVNATYYGATKIKLTKDLHWYAQKAIAHKIAYKPFLGANGVPNIWLEPISNQGESNITKIAQKNNIDFEELKTYNKWISKNYLPAERPFSLYRVNHNKPYQFQYDPHPELFPVIFSLEPYRSDYFVRNYSMKIKDELPQPPPTVVEKPEEAKSTEETIQDYKRSLTKPIQQNYITQKLQDDPIYGKEYVIVGQYEDIASIAFQYNKKIKRLRRWNNLAKTDEPESGTVIRLVPKKAGKFHVAGKFETVEDIALKYRIDPYWLMSLNNIYENVLFMENQKIYIRKQKPLREKVIIYDLTLSPKRGKNY
ncbi:MAG: transglycosylase SLT domain-containing protein [Bacteroidia bacterium]|nr:transglycosylase SLT domain-containing protein [Bacteroidia bacterium]